MEIQQASPSDADQILALQKRAFSRFPYFRAPQEQTIQSIKDEIAQRVVLKGTIGDAIVASVRGNVESGIGHIDRLIVHPEHQRKGFGEVMMKAIEATLGSASRWVLFTGSDNHQSISLYKKLGWLPSTICGSENMDLRWFCHASMTVERTAMVVGEALVALAGHGALPRSLFF